MSSVQNLAKNETLRVYYKASGLVSGLDVRFDFLRLSGSPIVLNNPADAEIPGRGIYYYDFTAPNEDIYVIGSAYVDDYIDLEPIIFKIGEPAQKCLFYYTEKNIVGQLTYRIYNTNGTTVQEGNLEQISSTNFWYAVFETPSEPSIDNNYFFEVDDTYSAQPFVAGVVSKIVDVFVISSALQNVFVSGEGIYEDTTQTSTVQIVNPIISAEGVFEDFTQTRTIQIISPTVSANALVLVNVFDTITSIQSSNADLTVNINSIAATIVQPALSTDALIQVSVFDAVATTPSEAVVEIQSITSTLIPPNITADANVSISVFTVTSNLPSILVGNFVSAEKQTLSTSILSPKITAEKRSRQPQKGYPYDDKYTLGAGAGIPIGVVSGNRSPYITIQFKICGDNFPCEEGIYQKESGLQSSIKVGVDNIQHEIKKSSVRIKGNITRHQNNKLNVEFHKLQKV